MVVKSMNCQECEWFRNQICQKAQTALSCMDEQGLGCLMKCQIMLLRDILNELKYLNEDEEDEIK